jgi:hypothetical protein
MNPSTEEKFSLAWDLCALEFEIAVKDLDAKFQEQLAKLHYPESIGHAKTYYLDRFDLCIKLWLQQAEQNIDKWTDEKPLCDVLEAIGEITLANFEENLKFLPAQERREILSSVALELGSRISRFHGNIKRMKYEALIKVGPDTSGLVVAATIRTVTPAGSIEDSNDVADLPAPSVQGAGPSLNNAPPESLRSAPGGGAVEDDVLALSEPTRKELKGGREKMLADARERWLRSAKGKVPFSWVHESANVDHSDAYRWKSGQLAANSVVTARIEDELRKPTPPKKPSKDDDASDE